jgi:hypothetical protein
MQNQTLKGRLAFFRFTEEDRTLARSIWPTLSSHLPRIMDGFYDHVKTVPHLATMIGDQEARLISAQLCSLGAHVQRRTDRGVP